MARLRGLDPQEDARNPAARDRVFGLAIMGFALTEAVALYALVIAFIILFV
jgi:F-type H+-transporting ATPase subunit c